MTKPNHITFLSSPSRVSMSDDWYEIATADHFWTHSRFNVFCRILPKNYEWEDVLDVGCGEGVVCEQIEKKFHVEVSGCDLNEKALEQAPSRRLPYYFYNIHEKKEDFHEKYQSIILFDVLEHIEDPIAFLKSVLFHQKEDGFLFVNVPVMQQFYSDYDKTIGHIKRYSRAALESELNAAGYQLERYVYWGISLLPLLLVRTLMLRISPSKDVVRLGFQPPHPIINRALKWLMHVEGLLPFSFPLGTSLMAIARKMTVTK
jgi:SAM-dependent methyltransferase